MPEGTFHFPGAARPGQQEVVPGNIHGNLDDLGRYGILSCLDAARR